MRMSSYYLSLVSLAVVGLLLTSTAGMLGWSSHLMFGLITAFVVVGLHSLIILFMLICSRLLREGIENCGLDPTYLKRSNDFFRERGGFFLALAGAFSIVGAGVLGYSEHAFEIPAAVHMTAGFVALLITFIGIPIELQALRGAESLLDEAREILDREDEVRASRGEAPVGSDHEPYKDSPKAIAMFVLLVPLLVYFYQVLIVWRSDFSAVSVHPWFEISAIGLVMLILAKRSEKRASSSS